MMRVHYPKVAEMAWNNLATDLGFITQTHTIADITRLTNRQAFLPHCVRSGRLTIVAVAHLQDPAEIPDDF
jgi:hypothetical protein